MFEEPEVRQALKMLHWDAVFSQITFVLTMGPFMITFGVLLGASNLVVGLLGAVGPLSQILQIPAVLLVEHTRQRKRITVLSAFVGRGIWFIVATAPLWTPGPWRVWPFLLLLSGYYVLNAITGCAFGSWVRDAVPENRMATFFSKRMMLATAAGAGVSLLAGMGVDLYKAHFGDALGAYAIIYLAGAVTGYMGLIALSRVPEPEMRPVPRGGILQVFSTPYADLKFRALVLFIGSWFFAINFSGPFFAVYMVKNLQLSMTWILGLTVLSQLANVFSFRMWGRICDRYNNKSVLNFAVPMYFLCLLLWPLMNTPGHRMALVMAIVFHALAGIATAGVNLSANNLLLQSAPRGRATPYLAFNALVQGVAASIAPIVAGCAADLFDQYDLSIVLNWRVSDPAHPLALSVPALHLHGLDFVFLLSFIFGLYAVHRLLAVREEGEVPHSIVRRELFAEIERFVRNVSTVAGLRSVGEFLGMDSEENGGEDPGNDRAAK